ncbi:MAG TPA: carboxypeptidase-like regulatory domain-containing protein [Candidatus Thermoplasmatota archaeon]|nr:carboxypeptidase-like regulatory domain-containing protein [Candidatus Thermoplasmatota archaeon]
MRSLTALILLALALPGCASQDAQEPGPVGDFSELELAATATTGIIRGIVVDDAIRPVAGATLALTGEGGPKQALSADDGVFGFDGLTAGTYFIEASRPGFTTVQVSADVVAGVAEPPIVKVLLALDPANRPYVEVFNFEGYLECGVTTPPVGVALCFVGGETLNDNTQITYTISKRPAWVQTEMVWESTQQLGNELTLMYSYDGGCGLFCDHEIDGTSPLLLQANQTIVDTIGLGNGTDLYIRVFNSDLDETDAGLDAVCTPVPDPVLGVTWCLGNGVGLTLEQRFNHYTHVFYGYSPPQDWRFTSGTDVPQPPQ